MVVKLPSNYAMQRAAADEHEGSGGRSGAP